jgi:hypothetical protein
MYSSRQRSAGYLLLLVLVFGSALFVILSSSIGFAISQSQMVKARFEIQRATDIAESGLNYYRWFLAHHPNDLTGGTGLPGPYVHQYFDPEGAAIGEFSLDITSRSYCGEIASIEIASTGRTYAAPEFARTVRARYVRPSVAEYSYIINSNVWAGANRVIVGPYQSNGGIRMDGRNLSTVSSGQTTWSCTPSFGCSPTTTRPGVFTTTANANQALFSFPAAPINFTGLTLDLAQMQNRAQHHGGIYIPPPPHSDLGHRVTFNGNGTITVRVVTGTTPVWGFSLENGWRQERNVISSTGSTGHGAGTYTIPTNCPVIFVEGRVWLDGVVDRKVTIAAADVDTPGIDPSIILNGNITYSTTTAGLLAIAEQDVLIGLAVPNDTVLNGIFIAQNGRFSRNHYCTNCSADGINRGLPSHLDPFVCRNSLTMNGTIVSNGRVGTQWTGNSCPGGYGSGFWHRYSSYDRNLAEDPPPLVPKTSDVYVFRDWREDS